MPMVSRVTITAKLSVQELRRLKSKFALEGKTLSSVVSDYLLSFLPPQTKEDN